MAMIIGREKERAELLRLYEEKKPEFVAVFGRRRVGKTYLIDQTFGDKIVFRHAGLSPVELQKLPAKRRVEQQLLAFQISLINQGYEDAPLPKDWMHAFLLLEKFLEKIDNDKRLLIFLDELPWLDTDGSLFITALEFFWNSWACHQDRLMLIVAGSATSWMENELIHNKGGLYGRVTYQIRLKPFTLHECEEYYQYRKIEMSRYDATVCYTTLGGIPYYLNYLNPALSLPQNIDKIFFADTAPLKGEFDLLFSSIFTNPERMKSIITALNQKSVGLTRMELAAKLHLSSGGSLSKDLLSLLESGFVMKYVPFLGNKRQEYYKLIDPFCLFWLRFLADKRSGEGNFFATHFDSPAFSAWRGLAFENICFYHIPQIKNTLSIGGVSLQASPYFQKGDGKNQGLQIDLVLDRNDNVINLCEAKFTSLPFEIDKDYHSSLVSRKEAIQANVSPKKSVSNVLITTFGLKKNIYSSDFTNVITLDDLFSKS